MNLSLRLSLSVAILLTAGVLCAQTPESPDNTLAQAAAAKEATAEVPAASPTIAPTEPIEPPSLIPPNSLPGPDAASLPQIPGSPEIEQLKALFQQSSLGRAADQHRLLVQVAELQTRIENDEGLHALKRVADRAPTDLQRRHRLREYYQAYYKKLSARTTVPELRAYLTAQEAIHEQSLLQPKVRHETDEAESARVAARQAGTAAPPQPTPVQARVRNLFHP